jgi:hypothetical protein
VDVNCNGGKDIQKFGTGDNSVERATYYVQPPNFKDLEKQVMVDIALVG